MSTLLSACPPSASILKSSPAQSSQSRTPSSSTSFGKPSRRDTGLHSHSSPPRHSTTSARRCRQVVKSVAVVGSQQLTQSTAPPCEVPDRQPQPAEGHPPSPRRCHACHLAYASSLRLRTSAMISRRNVDPREEKSATWTANIDQTGSNQRNHPLFYYPNLRRPGRGSHLTVWNPGPRQ